MSDEEKPNRYSSKRREEKIEIEQEDGSIATFILRELTGTLRTEWINLQLAKAKTDPKTGRTVGMKDYTGIESRLLHYSLHDSANARVSEAIINGWPSGMIADLAERARKLSGLDKEDGKDDAKND